MALEGAAGGEAIEGIVIGEFGWDSYGLREDHPPVRTGVVLTWDEARPMLDYAYDAGYGAPDCHAVWAWTASRVLFVVQYDGSTGVQWVPRNPTSGDPDMPGG